MTNFAETYKTTSDRELLDVVESVEGTYRPEAWNAATDELRKRGVAPKSVEDLAIKHDADYAARADQPLERSLKIIGSS